MVEFSKTKDAECIRQKSLVSERVTVKGTKTTTVKHNICKN